MTTAIVGGLINNGIAPSTITIVDPNEGQRTYLKETYDVATDATIGKTCLEAETIVLAVKPQIIPAVAEQLTQCGDLDGKLIISIAAGVTIEALEAMFGKIAIARTMPNTPALVGLGATGLYMNALSTSEQKATAERIIESFGICISVEHEELLDAVTAVSGSGPAYFFLMMEEIAKTGTKLGLAPEVATKLTLQTALGAATMAINGEVSTEELRTRVTSPNGTTHAAITCLQNKGFGHVIDKAMTACRDRATELGK